MSLRTQRVGELIRREAATIIERNFSFGDRFVTLHHAECAGDLKNCTIYVGVFGGDETRHQAAVDELNRLHGVIQRDLYKRVKLKNSPQLYFKLDRSAERGVRMVNLIEALPPAEHASEPMGEFVGNDGIDRRWETDAEERGKK